MRANEKSKGKCKSTGGRTGKGKDRGGARMCKGNGRPRAPNAALLGTAEAHDTTCHAPRATQHNNQSGDNFHPLARKTTDDCTNNAGTNPVTQTTLANIFKQDAHTHPDEDNLPLGKSHGPSTMNPL